MSTERDPRKDADVDLSAGAKVRKVRFEKEPEAQTTFRGDVSRRSFSKSQRHNLPKKVRKGVEYRDASIRWEARGWLEEEEENFGEKSAKRGIKKTERGYADDQNPTGNGGTQ